MRAPHFPRPLPLHFRGIEARFISQSLTLLLVGRAGWLHLQRRQNHLPAPPARTAPLRSSPSSALPEDSSHHGSHERKKPAVKVFSIYLHQIIIKTKIVHRIHSKRNLEFVTPCNNDSTMRPAAASLTSLDHLQPILHIYVNDQRTSLLITCRPKYLSMISTSSRDELQVIMSLLRRLIHSNPCQ